MLTALGIIVAVLAAVIAVLRYTAPKTKSKLDDRALVIAEKAHDAALKTQDALKK